MIKLILLLLLSGNLYAQKITSLPKVAKPNSKIVFIDKEKMIIKKNPKIKPYKEPTWGDYLTIVKLLLK